MSMAMKPGARRSARRRRWKKTCWISASTYDQIRACRARSRFPTNSTASWCRRRSGRPDRPLAFRQVDASANPALKISNDLFGQRFRLARGFIEQHGDRLRRGYALAFGKYHLVEGDGGAADFHQPKPHFDRDGPEQLGAEMHVA